MVTMAWSALTSTVVPSLVVAVVLPSSFSAASLCSEKNSGGREELHKIKGHGRRCNVVNRYWLQIHGLPSRSADANAAAKWNLAMGVLYKIWSTRTEMKFLVRRGVIRAPNHTVIDAKSYIFRIIFSGAVDQVAREDSTEANVHKQGLRSC